jgi:hypothetical protein
MMAIKNGQSGETEVTDIIFSRWELAVADDFYIGAQTFSVSRLSTYHNIK